MRAHIVFAPSDRVSVPYSQNVFVPKTYTLAEIDAALVRSGLAARIEGTVTVADEAPHWWLNFGPRQPLVIVDHIFA